MKESSMIKQHLHRVGRSLVPQDFHFWSLLSAIAATLRNKCWVEVWPGYRTYPNLFVFLIGPGGLGKNVAIDRATEYCHRIEEINHYRGRATGGALVDHIAESHKRLGGDPLVYLVTTELGESVGDGPVAKDFLRRMTGLWNHSDFAYNDRTRTNGAVEVSKTPTINWLAGTTMDWLVESVPKNFIEGGFFSRVIPVIANYDFSTPGPSRPQVPPDAKEVKRALKEEFKLISQLEGCFRLSNLAKEVQDHWYQNRPPPSDPAERPTWMRTNEMVHKLALVLAIAHKVHHRKGSQAWRIDADHLRLAIKSVESAQVDVKKVIRAASATKPIQAMDLLGDYVQINGRIGHSPLLKIAHKRGIHAEDVKKHMAALKDEGRVEFEYLETGALIYKWPKKGRRIGR